MGSGPFIIGRNGTICGRGGIIIGSASPDCVCGGGCDCRCPNGDARPSYCCELPDPSVDPSCDCPEVSNDPCCVGNYPGYFGSGAAIAVQFSATVSVIRRTQGSNGCNIGSPVANGSFTGSGVVGVADTPANCGGYFRRVLIPNNTSLPGSGSGECVPPCGSGSGPYTGIVAGDSVMTNGGGISTGVLVNVNEGGTLCSAGALGSLNVSVAQNCITGVATPTISPGNSGTPGVTTSWVVNTVNSATGISASVTSVRRTTAATTIADFTYNLSFTVIGASVCADFGACAPVAYPECVNQLDRNGGRLYIPRRLISIPTPSQVAAVARGGPIRTGGCSGCGSQQGLE